MQTLKCQHALVLLERNRWKFQMRQYCRYLYLPQEASQWQIINFFGTFSSTKHCSWLTDGVVFNRDLPFQHLLSDFIAYTNKEFLWTQNFDDLLLCSPLKHNEVGSTSFKSSNLYTTGGLECQENSRTFKIYEFLLKNMILLHKSWFLLSFNRTTPN